MSENQNCPRCGSSQRGAGSLQSTGQVRFRATSARFMTFSTADVEVAAQICLDCGLVQLVGDVERARKLYGTPAPAAART